MCKLRAAEGLSVHNSMGSILNQFKNIADAVINTVQLWATGCANSEQQQGCPHWDRSRWISIQHHAYRIMPGVRLRFISNSISGAKNVMHLRSSSRSGRSRNWQVTTVPLEMWWCHRTRDSTPLCGEDQDAINSVRGEYKMRSISSIASSSWATKTRIRSRQRSRQWGE